MKGQILVISGDGVNCERETAAAFERVGGKSKIVHVNEILNRPEQILNYSVLCFPGGFSFGDELRSGKILAEKLRQNFLPHFKKYTDRGGLTIGICNGFQVLIQLGVFFSETEGRAATLATNDHGTFLNRWVSCELTEAAKKSVWFTGLQGGIHLPMRHKEGRIVVSKGSEKFIRSPLRYTEKVNGAFENSAALLDVTGRIFGVMPHPEAALEPFLNPLPMVDAQKKENSETILKLFKNAVNAEVKS